MSDSDNASSSSLSVNAEPSINSSASVGARSSAVSPEVALTFAPFTSVACVQQVMSLDDAAVTRLANLPTKLAKLSGASAKLTSSSSFEEFQYWKRWVTTHISLLGCEHVLKDKYATARITACRKSNITVVDPNTIETDEILHYCTINNIILPRVSGDAHELLKLALQREIQRNIRISGLLWGYLFQTIDPQLYTLVRFAHVEDDVFSLFKVVEERFDRQTKVTLFQSFLALLSESLNLNEREPLHALISRINRLEDQIVRLKETVPPALKLLALYRALPSDYQEAISNSIYKDDAFPFEKACALLHNYEDFRKLRLGESATGADSTTDNAVNLFGVKPLFNAPTAGAGGSSQSPGQGSTPGAASNSNNKNSNKSKKPTRDFRCRQCRTNEHFHTQCPKRGNGNNGNNGNNGAGQSQAAPPRFPHGAGAYPQFPPNFNHYRSNGNSSAPTTVPVHGVNIPVGYPPAPHGHGAPMMFPQSDSPYANDPYYPMQPYPGHPANPFQLQVITVDPPVPVLNTTVSKPAVPQHADKLAACSRMNGNINSWFVDFILDSGSPIHTCNAIHLLHNVRKCKPYHIKGVLTPTIEIQYEGTLRLGPFHGNLYFDISPVAYSTHLEANLLSILQFNRNGIKVEFNEPFGALVIPTLNRRIPIPLVNGHWIIRQNIYQCMVQGSVRGREIPIRSNPVRLHPATVIRSSNPDFAVIPRSQTTVDELALLHQRTGHLGAQALLKLLKAKLDFGLSLFTTTNGDQKDDNSNDERFSLKSISAFECTSCTAAKMKRVSFADESKRDPPTRILEELHTDSFGPIDVKDPKTGKLLNLSFRYGAIVKDKFSGYEWGAVFKSKTEWAEWLISLILQLENRFTLTVGHIFSDNASELLSHRFQSFLRGKGIQHVRSPPYTPQLNGTPERAIGVDFPVGRTLLHACGLPLQYWAEAFLTSVYLRVRTQVLDSSPPVTSYERLFGQKPSLAHLRVFGSDAFYLDLPPKAASKLNPRGRPGIFVGYGFLTSVYRILDLDTGRVVETKHVKILENLAK